jgi:hypothetical protein
MNKQLTYIAPLKAGIILALLYGFLSLLVVPFLLIAAVFGTRSGSPAPAFLSVGFAILLPILYATVGFIGGVIVAALYNLVAKWTGGLEFGVRDMVPPVQ